MEINFINYYFTSDKRFTKKSILCKNIKYKRQANKSTQAENIDKFKAEIDLAVNDLEQLEKRNLT